MEFGDLLEIHGLKVTVHKWTAEELKRLEMAEAEHNLRHVEGRLRFLDDGDEKPITVRQLERDFAREIEEADRLHAAFKANPNKKNTDARMKAVSEADRTRVLLAEARQEELANKELQRDEYLRKRHLAYCHIFAAVAEGDKEAFMDAAPYDSDALLEIIEVLRLGKFYLPFSSYQTELEMRSATRQQKSQMSELLEILKDAGAKSESKHKEAA